MIVGDLIGRNSGTRSCERQFWLRQPCCRQARSAMFEVYAQTRYQQLELIGTGEGMNSSVFRAFDPYLQREIAVKEIRKSNLGNNFDFYCTEARTMFEVTDPNIVGVEYVCETADHIALALPY